VSDDPTFVTVRARDVKPYHYGIWSSTGGEPFANCICGVKWSEDGKHLWFMLESHNFFEAAPDEEVEVVDLTSNPVWGWSRKKHADWVLPPPPTPEPAPADLAALVAEVERLRAQVADYRKMIDGLETAAHEERAAVVAWLRQEAEAAAQTYTVQAGEWAKRIDDMADTIERGEHHREEEK
jgi:hypothetical protein